MADPREEALKAGLLTPRRTLSVEFDLSEPVLKEPYFHHYREGRQMLPQTVTGCIRLGAGIWQLEPLNGWGKTETTLAQSFVIRLADLSASTSLVEVPRFRKPTELVGVTAAPEMATSGDYFFTRRVEAGSSWDDSLGLGDVPPQISATNLFPLRLLGKTLANHTPLTGYCIKGWLPGPILAMKDRWLGIAFGGAIRSEGYGRFFLAIDGTGEATLFEKIGVGWTQQARWRFLAPADAPGGAFSMYVFPFFPAGIEFDSYTGGGVPEFFSFLSDRSLSLLAGSDVNQGSLQSYVFQGDRGSLGDAGGGFSHPPTGYGQLELYFRHDTRPFVQVSRLAYDSTVAGTILDKPVSLPVYSASTEHILRTAMQGYNVFFGTEKETDMSAILVNAETLLALTPDVEAAVWNGETIDYEGFEVPGGNRSIQAEISLTSDARGGECWWTPFLSGYSIMRNHHIEQHAPTTKTGGTVVSVSSTGPAYDPESETGYVGIQDLKNELEFLRSRGKSSVRVSTTFDEAGTQSTDTCVLSDGYTGRVTHSLRGKDGAVYPSDEWRDLEVECEGKWHRLTERFFHTRIPFHDSATAPDEQNDPPPEPRAWKATTVIRFLLSICGFDEDQLDIPDLPVRLFHRKDQKPDGILSLMPGVPVASYINFINRDLINGFLYWEPNFQTFGGWRLKQPPTGDETPVWRFTLDRPTGGPKLVHQSASYGANTSPILGPDDGFPFDSWVVSPEGNAITVSGGWDQAAGQRVQQTLVNEESFDAPAHPATADSANLDYVGHGGIVPVEYVDVSLDSQEGCDWIARRIYNLALRGRKFIQFTAELVIVPVPEADAALFPNHPRTLLRPGDLVNIEDRDGNDVLHILHQVSPKFTNQGVMRAEYLCELFRPDTTFSLIGDQGLPREVAKRESRKSLGIEPMAPRLLSPQSRRSDLGPDILALPVKAADPIKEGSTWKVMPDFSRLGSSDVLA